MRETMESTARRPRGLLEALPISRSVLLPLCLVCLCGAAILAGGCSSNIPMASEVFSEPPGTKPLTLNPGDTIEVKFRYEDELSDEQTIRPDGKITLQHVDDVQAAGLTPVELDAQLTELYKPYIMEPEVSVIVRTLVSQRVFVGGEVMTPGEIELNGSMTALQAIMAAGGFDKMSAQPKSVVVLRHRDNKRYAALLDLSKAVEEAEHDPFFLEPQDIVFVPTSLIEEVNLWVEKYINRTIPSGLDYSHQIDPNNAIGYSPMITRR